MTDLERSFDHGYTQIISYENGGGIHVPNEQVETDQIQDFVIWASGGEGPLRTSKFPQITEIFDNKVVISTEPDFLKHQS